VPVGAVSNSLLISDLHLTADARDEYRWRLFDWLTKTIGAHNIRRLFILGDLTDRKDFHSARLVNRLVDALAKLDTDIWVLRGNHDGTDPDCPYFGFLRKLPRMSYIDTPYARAFEGPLIQLLPHTRNPLKAWEHVELHKADVIFMHATVRGALAENGQALDGIPPGILRPAHRAKIYAGDIHVPQRIGNLTYVGAPYPVRFGDKFQGRAILLDMEGKAAPQFLPIPSIQRLSVTVDAMGVPLDVGLTKKLRPGDQVKIKVRLAPSEFGGWQQVRDDMVALCRALELDLCGIELERVAATPLPKLQAGTRQRMAPSELLARWCSANKLPNSLLTSGTNYLKEGAK
jgi:hypothetical protein